MKQEDYKSEIDTWLQSISEEAIQKVWHVLRVLDLEWQLRDHNIFAIPLDKLLKDEQVSKEDVVSILTNLQNKKILLVTRYLGEYPQSNDPDDPSGARITTIEYTPDIINSSDTQIRLIPLERFTYLENQLKLKLHKAVADKVSPNSMKWDNDRYKWLNETEFAFGDKIVTFVGKSSARKTIFEMQANAKGGYVTVADMAVKTGQSEGDVRRTIKDINDYLLINIGFKLEPNKKGAYRIQQASSL